MVNSFRQRLHLEPPTGWLNDPNGLCFFKGEYHVYFQYAPDSAEGRGNKCWGHFCSPDLIKWRFTGTVLFPDTPDDKDGVYSGCGFVKGDKLYLFYTGNVKEEGEHDYITSGRGANVILVTTEDGVTMSEKKVLLRNADYPDYCSCHVRDPKVWEEDGRYFMVLGARTLDDKGCVLFYTSDDLENWEFEQEVRAPSLGYMWECPDLLRFGEREYLSISPQGVPHEKYSFQNVYSSGYLALQTGKYTEWDCGFDFYAPQTFEAPDGRRLLIGWEGIGDIPYTNATTALGWQHCLTLPRELTEHDGVIFQQPARELKSLRYDEKPIEYENTVQLPFELEGRCEDSFMIQLGDILTLEYNGDDFAMRYTDLKASGGRDCRYAKIKGCKDIRVIADTSSVEVYLANGKKVLSSRMYPAGSEIKLLTKGVTGTLYRLNGTEVSYDG